MNQPKEREITFREFKNEFKKLESFKLSHVDPYYQKIDLHFGKYVQQGNQKFGELVLYVSGFWEVLNSGKPILDESFPQKEIVVFFSHQLEENVCTVTLFDETSELFLEFSNGYILHVQAEKDGHWIELLKKNNELLFSVGKEQYRSRIIQ